MEEKNGNENNVSSLEEAVTQKTVENKTFGQKAKSFFRTVKQETKDAGQKAKTALDKYVADKPRREEDRALKLEKKMLNRAKREEVREQLAQFEIKRAETDIEKLKAQGKLIKQQAYLKLQKEALMQKQQGTQRPPSLFGGGMFPNMQRQSQQQQQQVSRKPVPTINPSSMILGGYGKQQSAKKQQSMPSLFSSSRMPKMQPVKKRK